PSALRIPQPEGWGLFIPAYTRGGPSDLRIPQPEGWGLFIPAYTRGGPSALRIPQPEGWGLFIPAYSSEPSRRSNPPTAGLNERSPTFRLGDLGADGRSP